MKIACTGRNGFRPDELLTRENPAQPRVSRLRISILPINFENEEALLKTINKVPLQPCNIIKGSGQTVMLLYPVSAVHSTI